MTGPSLLFLAHRIPFPPDKGDKIRSYHLVAHLARRYRIHLGAFVDDPRDWKHAETLAGLCAEVHLVPISPGWARVRSLRGLAAGTPLTLPYYRDRRMSRWVERVVDGIRPTRVVAFSSAMAQYLAPEAVPGARRLLDMVDVDSAKWSQYGRMRKGLRAWVYRREGRRLQEFERRAAAGFHIVTLVSGTEAELFTERAPEAGPRVRGIPNGVDTSFFHPGRGYPCPYPEGGPVLVFTGAMDYWANVDAVTWWVREAWPRLRRKWPEARFWIVGARPTDEVRRLGEVPGVNVTGGVPDMRPFLAHATLAVAPLRVARGIQNKVLEAMAMARPVVATGAALDGLDGLGTYPLRADTPAGLAAKGEEVLSGAHAGMGPALRDWVGRNHGWDAHLDRFTELLEGAGETADPGSIRTDGAGVRTA